MQKNIALTPVISSQIKAIGRDPETKTLAIRFLPSKSKPNKPGSLYHYANVTAEDFKAFMDAESKGNHFGANIKNNPVKYPYQRIDDAKTYTT